MRLQITFTGLEFNQVQIQVKNFFLLVKSIDPWDLQLVCFKPQFGSRVDCNVRPVKSSNVAIFSIYLSRIQFTLKVLLIWVVGLDLKR